MERTDRDRLVALVGQNHPKEVTFDRETWSKVTESLGLHGVTSTRMGSTMLRREVTADDRGVMISILSKVEDDCVEEIVLRPRAWERVLRTLDLPFVDEFQCAGITFRRARRRAEPPARLSGLQQKVDIVKPRDKATLRRSRRSTVRPCGE